MDFLLLLSAQFDLSRSALSKIEVARDQLYCKRRPLRGDFHLGLSCGERFFFYSFFFFFTEVTPRLAQAPVWKKR